MMHGMVNIAVRAARRAGEMMVRHLDRLDSIKVAEKETNEYVTEIDHLAEEIIVEVIRDHYPEHAILAEERGQEGEHDFQWIIDPLDGTTNYVHGFPVFSISIAITRKGQLEHGVVYDPIRQEIFTASRGSGAQLEGRRIRVSQRNKINECLIATGFPYSKNQRYINEYMDMLKVVMKSSADVRRTGSAALDLCYVAAGRVDGFWEFGLKIWDIAAGSLIIREAGGRISDFQGTDRYLKTGNVVAGNPKVYAGLSKIFAPYAGNLE